MMCMTETPSQEAKGAHSLSSAGRRQLVKTVGRSRKARGREEPTNCRPQTVGHVMIGKGSESEGALTSC
jgi:hypothetical protein